MQETIEKLAELITDVDFHSVSEWKTKHGKKANGYFPV